MSNQSLLDLFKEQLKNQIPVIKSSLSLDTEGEAFAYWYFKHVLDSTDQEAKDMICEGGGDLGIDAVTVSEEEVVFYQFKNPVSLSKGIESGDVDKLISGLRIIINKDFGAIANEELKQRIQDVYSVTPTKYRIQIVTSGNGEIPREASVKLDSFCKENGGPSGKLFSWSYQNISLIHDKFYASNVPTLSGKLNVSSERMPYMAKIGKHETYMFHLKGTDLANLFNEYGEQLLQQNVRMFEGNNATNEAIRYSASSDNAEDFFHYNNGVSIICDSATPQPFNNGLEMVRPQIVNGGQTVRVLFDCLQKKQLRSEVSVAVRVITTGGDKDFASNVAVNLNNQTKVNNAFLRSNDPGVVQLMHSLASLGWHLERREGEVDSLTSEELESLENKFGHPLSNHIIPFKEGMQAYAATVYGDPELAKKDPGLIFTDTDKGHFTKILESGLNASLFANAFQLLEIVSKYVDSFKKIKRRRFQNEGERLQAYEGFFDADVVNKYFQELDPCIPQATVFLTALIYYKNVELRKTDFSQLVLNAKKDNSVIEESLSDILACKTKDQSEKSWPTLLKSKSFFATLCDFQLNNL